MPQHKITMEFTAAVPLPGSAVQPADATTGWTETWYVQADETDQVALARMLPGSLFYSTRRRLLSTGWRISRVRAIRFPGSRTGARAGINPQDGQGVYAGPPTAGLSADEAAYDRLVVTVASNAGKIRSWMMGGIGPDVVSGSGQYAAPGNFAANFISLQTVLVGNYAMRISTAAGPYQISAVYTAPPPADNTAPISPSSPAIQVPFGLGPFTVGNTVRIQGIIGMAGINGLWTVGGFSATLTAVVYLRPKRGANVLGTYAGGGVVRPIVYSLDPIASLFPEIGSSRKSGGPPFRRRGRRKTRR